MSEETGVDSSELFNVEEPKLSWPLPAAEPQ
jgi:hypothetical protein